MVDAGRAHAEGRFSSSATRVQPLPAGICLLKNTSGADWERGSVVAIGDPLLTDSTWGHPWFEADDPASDSKRLAILIDPLPDGQIGRAVYAGHYIPARVNVRNTDHRACDYEAGLNVLQSHWEGPIALEAAPTGTGEDLLFVRFPPVWNVMWAKTSGSGLPAIASGTYGTATITLYEANASGAQSAQKDAADADRTVTGENGYPGAAAADTMILVQRTIRGTYSLITEACGA